jgi:hypothetical protein
MKMMALRSLLAFSLILISFMVIKSAVNAESLPDAKCLIIVSGYGGYSQQELSKASSFREYLLDLVNEDDVIYLTDPTDPSSDGPATLSNIEDSFDWLISNSEPDTDVTVYISDHISMIDNNASFIFNDGAIPASIIDLWLDLIECSSLNIILNGERSGMGGQAVSGTGRDVLCSMDASESFQNDLFNITRSLEDPSADIDNDEIVSYVEAYWKEVDNLLGSGQNPVYYHD